MKAIILLCGVGEVGKTKTLKKFFGVSFTRRVTMVKPLQKTLNGINIYAVGLSSPQEQEGFCNVEGVKENIRKRTEKCEQVSEDQDYVLVIPFGIYGGAKGKLNEDCILKPIEWLRSQGFRVLAIYLRKASAQSLALIDLFMKNLGSRVIESTEEYDRQAKELEKFIRAL